MEENSFIEDQNVNKFKNKCIIKENNSGLESIINKDINEIVNFIKENNWKILDDKTYHFIQDIDRIWEIIQSFINSSKTELIQFEKGNKFLNINNFYKGKLLNAFEFKAKLIKLIIVSERKKIELIFDLRNGEYLTLKFNLYRVTEDNSAIFHIKIKSISLIEENIISKIQKKFIGLEFIKIIENIIKKETLFLTQYESGILLGPMEEVWDILTDNSKLVLVAPNNDCFIPININKVRLGESVLIPIKMKNIDGGIEIKLDLKNNNPYSNEWEFSYSIIDGQPFRIAKQTIFVRFNKINNFETQLSILTEIYGKINIQMVKSLKKKKEYVISSLKDYFENFCSPKIDV